MCGRPGEAAGRRAAVPAVWASFKEGSEGPATAHPTRCWPSVAAAWLRLGAAACRRPGANAVDFPPNGCTRRSAATILAPWVCRWRLLRLCGGVELNPGPLFAGRPVECRRFLEHGGSKSLRRSGRRCGKPRARRAQEEPRRLRRRPGRRRGKESARPPPYPRRTSPRRQQQRRRRHDSPAAARGARPTRYSARVGGAPPCWLRRRSPGAL
ncbi:uncharacterized protein Tco025E_08872 [Trypanosoma conorhini]|uniref:Uncharacterized protein n=1 Tax=Trypanosoma conorhini TaxID=83891 RepID=A0A3R7N4L5_9TRYP|nr:uncharacterized protein Tco025E_08872 [Trypanosoma conorhini]RNF00073.1 hypothetical protein Tco025E_08872 [Trypanosoma conorhini]